MAVHESDEASAERSPLPDGGHGGGHRPARAA